MPTANRVQEFVDCVLLERARDRRSKSFYHDDATMQENLSPPRGPRAALMEVGAQDAGRAQRTWSRR